MTSLLFWDSRDHDRLSELTGVVSTPRLLPYPPSSKTSLHARFESLTRSHVRLASLWYLLPMYHSTFFPFEPRLTATSRLQKPCQQNLTTNSGVPTLPIPLAAELTKATFHPLTPLMTTPPLPLHPRHPPSESPSSTHTTAPTAHLPPASSAPPKTQVGRRKTKRQHTAHLGHLPLIQLLPLPRFPLDLLRIQLPLGEEPNLYTVSLTHTLSTSHLLSPSHSPHPIPFPLFPPPTPPPSPPSKRERKGGKKEKENIPNAPDSPPPCAPETHASHTRPPARASRRGGACGARAAAGGTAGSAGGG